MASFVSGWALLLVNKSWRETRFRSTQVSALSPALLSFTSRVWGSKQTESTARGLGSRSHSKGPGKVPAAVPQLKRAARRRQRRADVSVENWGKASKGQGRGMSALSSRDGEKIPGERSSRGSNVSRKERAQGKRGRKTLGAKGAGQYGDIRNAELSLPSAHSCRPREANSMQDFAIYTDNFTRVNCHLQHGSRQLRVPDPRLFSCRGLFQDYFLLQQPQTQPCALPKLLRESFQIWAGISLQRKTEINQQPLVSQSMLGQAGSSVRN